MKKEKQTNSIGTKHSVMSNILYWVKYYRANSPVILMLTAASVILSPLFTMLTLYLRKVTLSLVEQQVSLTKLLVMLGGYILLYMLAQSVNSAVHNYNYHAMNNERQRIIFRLFLKNLRLNYSYVESEEGKSAYFKAFNVQYKGGTGAPSVQMLNGAAGFLIAILNFILYSTVLSTLSIWMAAAVLFLSILNYLLKLRDNRFWNSIRGEDAVNQKHYNYVKSAMGNVSAAKDIRIFNMAGWLRGRMERVISDKKSLIKREWMWSWQNAGLGSMISLVRDLGAYAYLIYMAVEGNMTASDFVLYFSAISGFSDFVNEIVGSIGSLRKVADDTDCVRNYMEMPQEDMTKGKRHISELARPVSIEFKDVSFSYQNTPVFSHFNLKIAAGEKLALVGVNGAGKTTLVKLLCGFYEPEEGQILFNGIDAREFPKGEIYELFSAVFQDVFLPPVRMDESIVLQETKDVEKDRLQEALEKAKVADIFREKGITMDKYMGTLWKNREGVELSGGQMQRLLVARALYKDSAVMVLDEPTAALDPIAESEVYQTYQKYSRDKTSIFISHRLASTSFSDRIVLLDKGRILEMGSHEELMEKNGAYAEMFRIQSSYYQEEENRYE